jgi:hypothetical protein
MRLDRLGLPATIRRHVVAAGSAFSVAAFPGISRPPQYRQISPAPAREIELAGLWIAALVVFGVLLGLAWKWLNARN